MLTDAVVVAVARRRRLAAFDTQTFQQIASQYNPKQHYFLITSGDTDVGSNLRFILEAKGFAVYEMLVVAHNSQHQPEYLWESLFMARHAAFLELGVAFHIFTSKHRFNNTEDLVVRCQQAGKLLKLYDHTGKELLDESATGSITKVEA